MTNEAKETLMNVWKQYAPMIPERERKSFMTDLALLVGVCIESSVTEFKAKLEKELPEIMARKQVLAPDGSAPPPIPNYRFSGGIETPDATKIKLSAGGVSEIKGL